jgi:hypothetical protein
MSIEKEESPAGGEYASPTAAPPPFGQLGQSIPAFNQVMQVQHLELEKARLALEQARFGLEQRRQGFEERRFAHTFALEQAQAVRLHRCTSLRDFYAPVQPDGPAQSDQSAQSAPADGAASPPDDAAAATDPAPVRTA